MNSKLLRRYVQIQHLIPVSESYLKKRAFYRIINWSISKWYHPGPRKYPPKFNDKGPCKKRRGLKTEERIQQKLKVGDWALYLHSNWQQRLLTASRICERRDGQTSSAVPEEINPTDTLLSDFSLPELWENKFLLF